MKKILFSLLTLLTISCVSIDTKRVIISNNELNARATKYINIDKNYIVAKATIKNLNTQAYNHSIYSDIKYDYNILSGIVSKSSGIIRVKSSLKVENNKLYLSNPEVISILTDTGSQEKEKIAKVLTELILNTLSYTPLYDFKNEYYAKDVYITDNKVIIIKD